MEPSRRDGSVEETEPPRQRSQAEADHQRRLPGGSGISGRELWEGARLGRSGPQLHALHPTVPAIPEFFSGRRSARPLNLPQGRRTLGARRTAAASLLSGFIDSPAAAAGGLSRSASWEGEADGAV